MSRDPRLKVVVSFLVDMVVPLGLYYGLRAFGVNQWLALVIGGILPITRVGYTLITARKLETLSVCTLSVVVCGTAIALLTGDVRLLLARESYLTGVLGFWILGTMFTRTPFIFTVITKMLPEQTAKSWRDDWGRSPEFRRVMRLLTVCWGVAFLIDALARVVMAYTLPVDVVPIVSSVLLAVMLTAVVEWSKAYGRRLHRARRSAP
ncbi:MAG TPA: VC0807 family protein [Pseudonocardiaceae bacterium]|nr:VC0807 family protein [Pseudonocardiaceae bacterium]